MRALEQEANVYLKKPCNSDNPSSHCPYYPFWPAQPNNTRPVSSDTDCWCETPWSQVAVQEMVDSQGLFELVSRDSMHDVRDTKPVHHAHIWNNCTDKIRQGGLTFQTHECELCTLNVTTVSESVYEKYEDLDTGFTNATREIRVKMKSRQLYRRYTTNPSATFEEDNNNVCRDVSRRAFEWALDHASKTAHQRL